MAISVSIIESAKQILAGIPDYISVSVQNVINANVYYTLDGSTPDITGFNINTMIMEHNIGDPLHGIIFLPKNVPLLELNILAIGIISTDTTTFYRRYGLQSKNIGIGRPGIKKVVLGGSAYTNTPSPNITADGRLISPDGYTEGTTIIYDISEPGYDGYIDGYSVAFSGVQITVPPAVYDHIDGYINRESGSFDEYSTTTLTPEQELGSVKLTDRGDIFTDSDNGLISTRNIHNIDPRSNTVVDSNNRQIEVIPLEDYPSNGYTIDGYSIDDDFDDAPFQQTTNYTSSGIFNPMAAYIEIDGRIDGYINGKPIVPGDRVIINKPYGELRYNTRKEDIVDALNVTTGYISGGLVCPIYDYNKGQAIFYYRDARSNRWLVSIQKITPPVYEIFSRRNGVVVGQVFKWISGRRQVLPG